MQGIHLYIGLTNLADVIENKEREQQIPLISAFVGAFFDGTNDFIKKLSCANEQRLHVEKFTGDRIHIVFGNTGTLSSDFYSVVSGVSLLVGKLNQAQEMQKLPTISINMGADFGDYENAPIDFQSEDKSKSIKEKNTIGFPANKAAKIQDKTNPGEIHFSNRVKDLLDLGAVHEISDSTGWYSAFTTRYSDTKIYALTIAEFLRGNSRPHQVFDSVQNNRSLLLESVNTLEQKLNALTSDFLTEGRRIKTYDSVELTAKATKYKGFVIYADIRHSTTLLSHWPQGSGQYRAICNDLQKRIYAMLGGITKNGCDHIQVQGDRETAMLPEKADADEKATGELILKTAFSLLKGNINIPLLEGLGQPGETLPIGIGISFGEFHGRTIGPGDAKENFLCGRIINDTDDAEDKGAKADNTIALTVPAYEEICRVAGDPVKKTVRDLFKPEGIYYVSHGSYDDYRNKMAQYSRQTVFEGPKPWIND